MSGHIPKFGYIGMTGDFIHIGHIRALRACSEKCRILIVGVMTDESVKKYKKHAPIMDMHTRAEVIKSIRYVKQVIFQDSFEYPHHLFCIKDFWGKDFVIFDSDEHQRAGADIIIPRVKDISSSLFRKAVNDDFDIGQCEI